ncbi:hypothetical protein GQ457_03G006560 [Hibiscus cannabinus]
MVVPLGPGKFYGSSLPRPRIYTETRFNSERVDPPVPVLDPLLSWANEAHWSMGGLSFKRLRLQGRIEGNVKKLKAQREKLVYDKDDDPIVKRNNRDASASPPPAPMAVKRRGFFDFDNVDDEESESEGEEMMVKRVVRKLGEYFERVANDEDGGGGRSKEKRSLGDGIGIDVMKIVEEVNVQSPVAKKKKDNLQPSGTGTRCSPRLAKRG